MSCRSELRGLGAVHEALAARGGALLALSVDEPADSLALAAELALPFRLLSDTSRATVRAFGLLHEGGGPGGSDIAVPALFLLRPDGSIAWRHVAQAVQDRADPADVIERVAKVAP